MSSIVTFPLCSRSRHIFHVFFVFSILRISTERFSIPISLFFLIQPIKSATVRFHVCTLLYTHACDVWPDIFLLPPSFSRVKGCKKIIAAAGCFSWWQLWKFLTGPHSFFTLAYHGNKHRLGLSDPSPLHNWPICNTSANTDRTFQQLKNMQSNWHAAHAGPAEFTHDNPVILSFDFLTSWSCHGSAMDYIVSQKLYFYQ